MTNDFFSITSFIFISESYSANVKGISYTVAIDKFKVTLKSVPILEGKTGYTVIKGTKFTLVPEKGFQKTARLYQAVIARAVKPRHILVMITRH